MCDKKIPLKLKGRIYRMVIRPALLYGTEWSIKWSHIQRMMVAEMRMIHWICGYTRLDKISNEVIRDKIGVAYIEYKIKETRLRWFGHIKSMDALVRRSEKLDRSDYRRSRGRSKKSWSEVIRHDLKTFGLVEGMAQDRKF